MTERDHSSSSSSDKPAIVWVDHHEKVSEIVDALKELKRSKGSFVGMRLEEVYNFVTVIVPPGDNLEERALAKISEDCPSPSLVLVDLNFHRDHPPEGIRVGRLLAVYLRDKMRPIPVGLYTRYDISPLTDKALISTDRLAVVFDNIRKFYEGPDKINADDWVDVFSGVIDKAREGVTLPPHQVQVLGRPPVEWAPGHPLDGSRSFREAAPKLTSLALANSDSSAALVTLTQLRGGFSGSYVVKAKIEDSAPFVVIKVDEDIGRLKSELEGYRIIERRIEAERYLPLLSQGPSWPVTLYDSWWGAFAMKYAGKSKPLIEHNGLDALALSAIYQRLWADCLMHLYGDPVQRTIEETEILTQEVIKNANNGWEYLSPRYQSKTTLLSSLRRSEFTEAISFVTSPRPIIDDLPFDVPWVNQVHGDLNCRNILIDESHAENFRLIDFPNVAGGNCLAVDFVKAEAELVLIIMDWWTGRDCDFERLETWGALTAELSSDLIPNENRPDDSEAARILPALRTIRQTYAASAGTLGEPNRVYRLYLVRTVLRYLAYSDITIAKRFLALLWAGQLLLKS